MLWLLLSLVASSGTGPDRWFAIEYKSERECQRDLAGKLVERRKKIDGLVLLETCRRVK